MNARTLLIPALLLSTGLAAQSGTAVYEITFQSSWSRTTHPVDFPVFPHYSPLIGGTHKASTSFWMPGGIATDGIEQMAETGGTGLLSGEIQTAINSGGAKSIVRGGGLNVTPGSIKVRFTVSATHPTVTLVTMVAPSPDWFVGLHGYPLMKNGRWIDSADVRADVYDAGTDSGPSFQSPNANQRPKAKIAIVTTASGPFKGYSTRFGTFQIRRIASTAVYGCGVNPAGSMTTNGEARLGQTVRFFVHDPTSSMPRGSNTALYFSLTADPGFPCGTRLPGFGMRPNSSGEILLGTILTSLGGSAWQGSPVSIPIGIPNDASLVNVTGYLQGALTSGSRIGITDAVEITLGR